MTCTLKEYVNSCSATEYTGTKVAIRANLYQISPDKLQIQTRRDYETGYSVSLCLQCKTQAEGSEVTLMFGVNQERNCQDALEPV